MNESIAKQIELLKEEGVSPLCTIWVVHEEKDDDTHDVNVWDEIENERAEILEEYRFQTAKEAEDALQRIVDENPDITFVRIPNERR